MPSGIVADDERRAQQTDVCPEQALRVVVDDLAEGLHFIPAREGNGGPDVIVVDGDHGLYAHGDERGAQQGQADHRHGLQFVGPVDLGGVEESCGICSKAVRQRMTPSTCWLPI